LILSALATGLAALAVQSPASAQTVTLRVAHTAAQVEPYQTGFEKFREEVEKATGGAIKVEIFPNAQLGDEGSVLKSIQSGSIAMATVANATIADFAQEMHIFDLPFLFKDRSQAYHVLDGEIGQSVGKALADKGFVLLGYYEAGVRNVLNNQKPITSLTDFKGMKIRVIPSSINIDTFRALGANPVPLNYSELYTALQTHVVAERDRVASISVWDGTVTESGRAVDFTSADFLRIEDGLAAEHWDTVDYVRMFQSFGLLADDIKDA